MNFRKKPKRAKFKEKQKKTKKTTHVYLYKDA